MSRHSMLFLVTVAAAFVAPHQRASAAHLAMGFRTGEVTQNSGR